MFQDIIRLTVQRIFNDKILLGLLIVCLLGFFVGGFNNNSKDEPPVSRVLESPSVQPKASEEPAIPSAPGANYASKVQLDPSLAIDFVKWWMKMSMDYAPKSAAQSHEAATNWMSPEALKAFNEAFWSPDIAQQVCSGETVGAFQPISVRAVAVNPDHTVVVNLTGTLVLQAANARPIANQVQMNLLVHKTSTGLRITGINSQVSTASTSIY